MRKRLFTTRPTCLQRRKNSTSPASAAIASTQPQLLNWTRQKFIARLAHVSAYELYEQSTKVFRSVNTTSLTSICDRQAPSNSSTAQRYARHVAWCNHDILLCADSYSSGDLGIVHALHGLIFTFAAQTSYSAAMHPDRYPMISLTDEERAKYDQSARIFLLETMAERAKFNPERIDPGQWEYVRRRQSMSVYHSVEGTPDPAVLLMLGTGFIDGSLEDVMNGVYCDTTEDLRTAKVLLGYPLAGGAVMNVSERRCTKDPYRFAGIKWCAAKSVWGLMRDRDILTYERTGLTVDADGEQWGYHTLQSMRRPEWPMEAISGMQRQHTATCYLFRPRRDLNKTEIFLWGSIYKFGKYPDKVIYYGVATTWLNVVYSPKSGHAKKFSALIERADSHGWTATSNACHVCTKQPLLGSCSACAGCHQSVCKDCSRQKEIFALDARGRKPLRRLFCVLCIKSVIGSAHWSVDDHIEASNLESEPELSMAHTMSSYTGSESVSTARTDSTFGDGRPADPFRPRVSSSPTANFHVLGAQGPLDPDAQLVLDW